VIGLAQLMVVLDLTVMNIALPSAQRTAVHPRGWADQDERIQRHAGREEVASQQPARGVSERDPGRRWAAIERTYTEDVRFVEPEGEFVGWQALSDQAQKLLDGPLAGFVHEEDGPPYVWATLPRWRGVSGRPASR
jgi:hypothetical protein